MSRPFKVLLCTNMDYWEEADFPTEPPFSNAYIEYSNDEDITDMGWVVTVNTLEELMEVMTYDYGFEYGHTLSVNDYPCFGYKDIDFIITPVMEP